MPALLTRPRTPSPSPIQDVTRRDLLRGAGALGAGWVLAACGDDAGASRSEPGATRRVVDAYGNEVEIPADPKRVVAADNGVLPWVLELGMIPVGGGSIGPEANEGRDFFPTLYRLGAGEVQPFSRNEPNLELLATLDPDLIIVSRFVVEGRVTGGAGAYGGLAPVVTVDTTVSPFEQLRAVGRILGRQDRAEELVAEVERALRRSARDVEVETVSFVGPADAQNLYFYTEAEPVTGFLAELLGFRVVPGPERADESGGIFTSTERLGEASGQALVILDRPLGNESVTEHPLWDALPAVRNGNVHNAGSYLVYAGNGGLAALREQLVGIADFLETIG